MEVILWSVLLGFAVLVTALVVSLHYHRKYTPILRQMSERLSDKDFGETDRTSEKAQKKTDEADSNSRKPTDERSGNPINNAQIETANAVKTVEDADEKLFRQLTDAIRNEQLYTVPKFGRTELVERFQQKGGKCR